MIWIHIRERLCLKLVMTTKKGLHADKMRNYALLKGCIILYAACRTRTNSSKGEAVRLIQATTQQKKLLYTRGLVSFHVSREPFNVALVEWVYIFAQKLH
jgi:hypothetical protein